MSSNCPSCSTLKIRRFSKWCIEGPVINTIFGFFFFTGFNALNSDCFTQWTMKDHSVNYQYLDRLSTLENTAHWACERNYKKVNKSKHLNLWLARPETFTMAPAKQGYGYHRNSVRIMTGKSEINLRTGFPEDSSVVAPQASCVHWKSWKTHYSLPLPRHMLSVRRISHPPHLTCQVFGTGSGWRTGAAARLCYQAPVSTAACSGARLPQSPLTDTPDAPAQPTLGRKAYVLSVLEHQHGPRRGGNNMLEVMEELKADKWKQKIK